MAHYNGQRDQQIFPNSFFIANLGRSVAHKVLFLQSSGRDQAYQETASIDPVNSVTNAQIIRLLATSSSLVITRRVFMCLQFYPRRGESLWGIYTHSPRQCLQRRQQM